ncbi:MAG: FAD binding domain-containing protein, partial [Rhodovibrionaceae bacterium]
RSEVVRENCPLVSQALALNGHPATRHRGTVGGTLAHADAVAELPGVAVALDAEIVLQGPAGRRRVSAGDYFLGPLVTSIGPGEMLREVRFPCLPNCTRTRFLESGIRAHDFAISGIAAALEMEGQGCISARLAAIGVGAVPFRLVNVEEALVSRGMKVSVVADALAADLAGFEVMENPHATARYRKRLIEALVCRVVEETLRDVEGEVGE